MTNLNDTGDLGWTRRWDKIEGVLVAVFLIAAWGVCLLEVFTRLFLRFAYYWTEEFILYFLIWSTFLGASSVLKKGEHIRLSFVVDSLSTANQRYLDLLTSVIGLVFCVMLSISGFLLIHGAFVSGETSTSLARIPKWMPYSIMPLAGILLVFRFVERIILIWRKEGQRI